MVICRFSLTPGFSPVPCSGDDQSRFNGFSHCGKVAEAAERHRRHSSPG